MPVSEATYERLALEDLEGQWEYVCGHVRQKPPMTQEHNSAARLLVAQLARQLSPDEFEVGSNAGRTRRPEETTFIPDVLVIPVRLMTQAGTMELETFSDPLPFVAEVWSPSTGDYDVDTKFPDYKQRGDLEIWRTHPYDREIIAWRKRADGSYSETRYTTGDVPVESLPGVTIRLESLFR
jgi:Uma2 family endonuclease